MTWIKQFTTCEYAPSEIITLSKTKFNSRLNWSEAEIIHTIENKSDMDKAIHNEMAISKLKAAVVKDQI